MIEIAGGVFLGLYGFWLAKAFTRAVIQSVFPGLVPRDKARREHPSPPSAGHSS